MSYLNEEITINNYTNILSKKDNIEHEEAIIKQIYILILKQADSYFEKNKDLSDYSISWDIKEDIEVFPRDLPINASLTSFKDIINNMVFIDKEKYLSQPVITKRKINNLLNQHETINIQQVKNDIDLNQASSYETDLFKWNNKQIRKYDLSSILHSLNSVLNYKKNKIFNLNFLDVYHNDREDSLLFNSTENIFYMNNTKIKEIELNNLNAIIKHQQHKISSEINKNNVFILDSLYDIISFEIYQHPVVCENALIEGLKNNNELFMIKKEKGLLNRIVNSSEQNKIKNRL